MRLRNKKQDKNAAAKATAKYLCAAIILFLAFGLAVVARSEISNTNRSNLSKETQIKLLTLEEARVSLQTAKDMYDDRKSELEDMQELYKQDVVTGKEVSEAETELKDAARNLELAKIDLAKTALNFLQDVTYLEIAEAYQYLDAENNRHMNVTIKNASDLEGDSSSRFSGYPYVIAHSIFTDVPPHDLH